MLNRKLMPVALVVVGMLALAGCSKDSSNDPSNSASASASATPTPVQGKQDAMPTATGDFGDKPTLTFPDTDPPKDLTILTLKEGDGDAIKTGDFVQVNYLGQVWGADQPFDNSYDRGQAYGVTVGAGQVIKGWDYALPGVKVGSRVEISIPPDLGYGSAGNENAGIKGTDTIVFVIDVVDKLNLKATANATAVEGATPAGITVTGDLGEHATVSIADGTAEPTKVTTTVLATGKGEKLAEGDTAWILFSATGWDGSNGGDNWSSGPTEFSISSGDTTFAGLAGVPVGSRVLIEVPANGENPAFAAVMDIIAKGDTPTPAS